LLIRLLPQSMLSTVKFDDQTGTQTIEVNYKGAKPMLPAELYSGTLPIA
jgi:hypothetical protein